MCVNILNNTWNIQWKTFYLLMKVESFIENVKFFNSLDIACKVGLFEKREKYIYGNKFK